MGSIYLLCQTCRLRHPTVCVDFSGSSGSLLFNIICTLFEGVRVSWTTTDVRTYRAEIGTTFNVKIATTTTRRACTFLHSPSSRRGHLVRSMQFVRTAQFKHKHLLALSTEDGGGGSPPRPKPLYIIVVSYLERYDIL